MALLTRCREITPHTAEVAGVLRRSEAARHFLRQLHHPQVTFRAVVVEGHREVIHEAQNLVAAAQQPVDEPPLRRQGGALLLRRVACVVFVL